jgi:hypothetical protein
MSTPERKPPEELVDDVVVDPRTGREVKIKAWRGNTIELGGAHLGAALGAAPDLGSCGRNRSKARSNTTTTESPTNSLRFTPASCATSPSKASGTAGTEPAGRKM